MLTQHSLGFDANEDAVESVLSRKKSFKKH